MTKINIGQWIWQDFDVLTSTNDWLLNNNLSAKYTHLICSAKQQTQARGRRGKKWISPLGNLYFSQMFYCSRNSIEIVYKTTVSLLQTIQTLCPNTTVKLKWPNDILINEKKLCGILIEKNKDDAYIIGIGINLQNCPNDKEVNYPAICLKDIGYNISREDFLRIYIDNFEKNLSKDFTDVCQIWLQNAYKLNDLITIKQNNTLIRGNFVGIDNCGTLLLKQDNNDLIKIVTGEILYNG